MKKRVLVIGGGISGLGAARELLRKGHSVTVLEGRHRLGGRIHTIHEHRIPIELGAEFLHGQTEDMLALIKKSGVSTHQVPDRFQYVEQGSLKREKLWDKMSDLINRIDAHGRDCSFREFLATQSLNAHNQAEAIGFVQGFHAANSEKISAHALLRGEFAAEHMADAAQSRINEGYSALISFLDESIREAGGEIVLDTEVKAIRWTPGKVQVELQERGVPSRGKGDAAVITLPLGVLKAGTIEFDPPLNEKREAIEQLQFGNVVKVIFIFDKEWWPEKDFGFIQSLDEPIPTWWSDPRGPMLTGWAGGPKADALDSFSPEQLKEVGLKTLSRIFGARSLEQHLVGFHFHDWRRDPKTLGAYSYIPVNGLDLPKLLAEPIAETLYFAGEATVEDAQMGTVFGAYESGLRAAEQI